MVEIVGIFDDFFDRWKLLNEAVRKMRHAVAVERHHLNHLIERNKNRQLDDENQDRLKRIDAEAFVELHLHGRFELFVASSLFFDFCKLRLHFAHLFCLVKLFFHERIDEKTHQNREKNDRHTEVAARDNTIEQHQRIEDRLDYNSLKHNSPLWVIFYSIAFVEGFYYGNHLRAGRRASPGRRVLGRRG